MSEKNIEYCSTWASSQYDAGYKAPSADLPDFTDCTLRQIIRVSGGAERIRVRFSNFLGKTPLELKSVHIAKSSEQGTGHIDLASDTVITFGSKESVTIPAGEEIISDTFDFKFDALTELAISIFYGNMPEIVTGHAGSRTFSFFQKGNHVSNYEISTENKFAHWYTITSIDVEQTDLCNAYKKAVVCFGDSITDGRGSTDDKQNRWTDILAQRLQSQKETQNICVLNQGIGGTLVAFNGTARFEKDVLNQTGLAYVILLYGINDIIYANLPAQKIISVYKNMIQQLHKKNVKVFGGTILPFGKCGDYTEERNNERKLVNEWIRNTTASEGGYDAVIDFEAVMKNPDSEKDMADACNCGDGLHPSPLGYKTMAECIDLSIFS